MPNSYTPNQNLAKPAATDNYDIGVPNSNMDLLDTILTNIQTKNNQQDSNLTTLNANVLWLQGLLSGLGPGFPKIALVSKSTTSTTDASGFYTFTHGLGFTPAYVMAWNTLPASRFGVFVGADTLGATTVRLRWMNFSGGALNAADCAPFVMLAFGLS